MTYSSIEPTVCCRNLEGQPNGKSPFQKMIIEGFYDGPTSGLVQCEVCSASYRFLMVDWDDRQDVRVLSLAPLPVQSFDRVVSIISEVEPVPWPMLYPWRIPSDDLREFVEVRIKEIVDKAGPPTIVAACSRYGDTILAAKGLDENDLKDVQDWFYPEGPKGERDWFSFLGLNR